VRLARASSVPVWASLVAVLACACVDADPPALRTLVTVISTQDGQAATEATQRLCEYGRRSLVVVEAALHTATPPGRKRLLRAIRQLGDADAIPLVSHLAQYDEDEGVRAEAERTSLALAARSTVVH